MWQILKAEFRYTSYALIVAYSIAILFLVAALRGDWGFYNYMWNTTIVYFIFMGLTGTMTFNEKRYRLYSMLPVRPDDIGVADGLYVLLVQFGMSVLWIFYLLCKPNEIEPGAVWMIVANNALILTVITLLGIHYHAGFFDTTRYKRLNWLALLSSIAVIVLYSVTNDMFRIVRVLSRYYATPPVAFALVLVWIAVSALSGEVFRRRKSYLA